MNAALLSRLPLSFRKAKRAETEFWPALPDESLAITDKLHELPDDAPASTPVPAEFPRQFQFRADAGAMEKTLAGLRKLPVQPPAGQVAEAPHSVAVKLLELAAQAQAETRAEQFAADLSLPVFGLLARDFGCLTADAGPVRPGDGTEPAPDPMAGAKALYRDAWALDQPEGPAWDAVTKAAEVLYDALGTYRDIDRGGLHWESEYSHLKDEADPEEAALAKAAEEVAAAAADLRSAMDAHGKAGTETTSKTGESA